MTDFQVDMLVLLSVLAVLLVVVIARRTAPAATPRQPATIEGVWAEVESLRARQERIDHQLVDQGHDIKQLRTMVNALPTHRQVSEIALEVAEVRGDIKVLTASAAATAASNKRIEDWIITKIDKAAS